MDDQLKPCPQCAEPILAAATKCKHCGSVLKNKSVTLMQGLLVIGGGIVLVAMCTHNETPKTASIAPTTVTGSAVQEDASSARAAAAPLPEIESSFIQLVSQAQTDSAAALNDMQRGGIKAKRDHALCALLAGERGTVSNWIGTVSIIDSNGDGKGVLGIKIANDLTISTVNNALSNTLYPSLIEPGSEIFTTASAMTVGQPIMFSGSFFRDDEACFAESSLTLHGNLGEPDFLFRFSAVSIPHAVADSASPATNLAGGAPTETVPEPAPQETTNQVMPAKMAAVTAEQSTPSPPPAQESQEQRPAIRAHSEPFIIRGVEKRCNDITQLDRALSTSYDQYFDGWTRADYDEAIIWSSACAQYGWQSIANSRVSLLQARETSALTR